MIFISAGHHSKDPGAVSNGYQENQLAIELRDLTTNELSRLRSPYIVDRDYETLAQYLKRIQTGSGSVVCEYHFNAAAPSATGVEVIVSNYATSLSNSLANDVCRLISSVLDIPNRGVKTESQSHRGTLGLMRESGIVILVEVCFITNAEDMRRYQANKKVIAKGMANLLKEYDERFL